ncbi:MAG: hypothetical protein Q7Q71_12440 [Verrucomicrobiota bacterium JB023]|nr:hypothetical protein [Verrucomicrobiota bacterium JB023]
MKIFLLPPVGLFAAVLSVKRRDFIGLASLSAVALATNRMIQAANDSPLQQWVVQVRGRLSSEMGSTTIRAEIPPAELPEALQSLAARCETLHAEGNRLRGNCDGVSFELILS